MEGFLEAITAFRHGLGADCEADLNATITDLVGDVLNGFETGGAEAIDGRRGGGAWEAGSQARGANVVGSFGVGDLGIVVIHK